MSQIELNPIQSTEDEDQLKSYLPKAAVATAGALAATAAISVPAQAQTDPVADVNGIITGLSTIVTAALALGVTVYGVVYSFKILKKSMR